MRVLLLNQTFYPDVAATAQHALDLAKYLTSQRHQVVVVSSRSLYGKKGAQLPKHEIIDGIEIHRVGMSLFGKSSIFARILDFALFYLLATFKVLTIPKPDVVIPFTTPPFIALVGWLLKFLKGSRFVYWVMDLYPDLPIACDVMKEQGLSARLFERINRFCLRHADKVVVLGRCMRDRVIAKGINPSQLQLISVWSDTHEIPPSSRDTNSFRKQWGVHDAFVVMYSGNFGIGHDSATISDAALRLKDHPNIRFVFVGGGKRMEELQRFASDHSLSNLQIHPYQPREKLAESLGAGDLHLISLLDRVLGIMVPSKLFGIMASQRPSIFIGDDRSEIARVLLENQAGLVIPCGQGAQLAAAIIQLASEPDLCRQMGARARQALALDHNRASCCAQWEQLLLSVTGKKA